MPYNLTGVDMDDVWSPDTGETVGEAMARFATFGPEVPDADVPALVRAGEQVWSFGYGEDPEEFTVIEESDLDNTPWTDENIVDWRPFRLDGDSSQVATYAKPHQLIDGKWVAPLPHMPLGQALAIVSSRLEAVMEVGARVDTAMGVLDRFITKYEADAAAEEANPRGHQMGHNLCIYCLQYDEDPTETCPERPEEDDA